MTTLRNYELMLNGDVYVGRMKTPSQQLRCVFDVIAFPGDAYATMDLRLYNIASASSPKPNYPTWSDLNQPQRSSNTQSEAESLVPKSGDTIQLSAGYTQFETSVSSDTGIVTSHVKDEIATVFGGVITNVFRERDGANVVTRILCRSGINENDAGVANSSYGQGVTLYDVLKDLASAWGKQLICNKDKCQTIVMTSGYVVDGDITREIQTLANSYKFKWTNFNGQLSVTFPNDARTSAKHVISETTGMIGMPEISGGTSDDSKQSVFVDVAVRLNPYININDQIQIDAQYQSFNVGNAFVTHVEAFASGIWNVLGMRYRGDNWGGQWRLDLSCINPNAAAETTLDAGSKLVWGKSPNVDQEFRVAVREVAREQGIQPNWMMIVMAYETGHTFLPYRKNPTSGATGLIQFTPIALTTPAMKKYTIAGISRMSAPEQIRGPVRDYFNQFKGRIKNLGDCYMAVFAPAHIGEPDSTILYSAPSKAYHQNRHFDTAHKGYITRADCVAALNESLKMGQQYAY